MPTYEYACKQCGEHLEVVQSFHDEPLTVCHNCGGELKKVFGSIGIVFKGSGFYKTDSRSSSTASKTSTEKASEAKPDSTPKTETKSESGSPSSTTPAAASTPKPAPSKAAAS